MSYSVYQTDSLQRGEKFRRNWIRIKSSERTELRVPRGQFNKVLRITGSSFCLING